MGKQNKKLVTFGDMYVRYLDDLADRMEISSPELIRRIVERYVFRYSQEEGMAYGVEVKVLKEYKGNLLPRDVYLQDGQVYVEGIDGERYAIAVRNQTSERIEVVISVDGLDITDGEEASFEKRGFVVPAFSEHTFSGFRLDDAEVATFRFGVQGSGYASKIGKAQNVGVIGVAMFQEKRISQIMMMGGGTSRGTTYRGSGVRVSKGLSDFTLESRGDTSRGSKGKGVSLSSIALHDHTPEAFSCSVEPCSYEVEERTAGGITLEKGRGGTFDSEIRERNLETQFGERREEKVSHTTFVRKDKDPWEIISIRYDSRANLEALGINLNNTTLMQRENADPFPASTKGCTPPPGWSGH